LIGSEPVHLVAASIVIVRIAGRPTAQQTSSTKTHHMAAPR